MWSDNETNRDFVNFRCVADTVSTLILEAKGQPLSIGISGGWGTGKSTMMKLTAEVLKAHERGKNFLFVEFNAWLYQGFDDAKAALIEVVAQTLVDHCEKTKTGLQEARNFLGRVNWLRLGGLAAISVLAAKYGIPPIGLLGEMMKTVENLSDGEITETDSQQAGASLSAAAVNAQGLIAPKGAGKSPPTEIRALRNHFSRALSAANVTLVVLIDDLDRCLPDTAIATLEAIRLFLFMDRTAFVIAADDQMIRLAVRSHFKDLLKNEDLVTNYFDKLIQIPIRVPPLGTQEVRAYLMMLFIENSTLERERKEELRGLVCDQLSNSWRGNTVDRKFISDLLPDIKDELSAQLDLAERIAPLMTRSKQISGNPRLIKRFLNTLYLRLAIAKAQRVTVDESALAKMLLFERCGTEDAYAELVRAVNEGDEGKPAYLAPLEAAAGAGKSLENFGGDWAKEFPTDWLTLDPPFSDLDLRAVVYVSREHLPIISASDKLSSEAASILAGLLELKQSSNLFLPRLRTLTKRESGILMERLLTRASRETSWGVPPILHAIIAVIEAEVEHSGLFTRFLLKIHGNQITATIVPLLGDKPWAKKLLEQWEKDPEISKPVKGAIRNLRVSN